MAKRGGQLVLQEEINNNDDWAKMLEKPGIFVVDVYTEWCGPCIPMIGNLKKIKLVLGGEILHYAIANSNNITVLERFRNKSEPHWMFFFDGKLVNLLIGTNAPKLMKLIAIEVEQYDKFKNGDIQREFIPLNKITEEERNKMIEVEEYHQKKIKKEKKIRDDRMLNVREHTLKKFSMNVQMQTCVMFFPHTVKYVMVEKPPEEGAEELEEPPEPVMVERRVCEVANMCARKYEELIVVDAKEKQLTETTLDELFFFDQVLLKSFPVGLINQLLTEKVYAVMLSLPTVKYDAEDTDDLNPPDPINLMGIIEQRMSTVIYGNGDPLNPSPDSFAAENVVANDAGEKIPSLYTPTNPLSKASALAVLFRKYCENNGYVAPQPPSPQYLIMFDMDKANSVLPVIEELEDNIVHFGFFRSVNSENPTLLCKDPELLTAYGIARIGNDCKLVVSVIKDEKDQSLLRFVDFGPIYVSPNENTGIDDAIKFFSHNYDELDGEVKVWLTQSALDENLGGEDEIVNEEYVGEENELEEQQSFI